MLGQLDGGGGARPWPSGGQARGAGHETLGTPGPRPWLGLKRHLAMAWPRRRRHRVALACGAAACGLATYLEGNASTGAVTLYHASNAPRISTTATGINITGNTITKGYFASEATNSTNKWLAYTYTDNTFRFNYNGAGSDEFIIDPDGQQTINAPAGDGNPAVALTMSGGSAGFNWAHTDFQASLGSNCNLVNMFGISGTARNAGYIGFKRIGALGATTNILTLGLHSADNVLNINGNSNVGIGTTSPSEKLTVTGGSIDLPTANSFIKGAGHNVFQVDATRTYFYGGTNGIQIRTANNANSLISIGNTGSVSMHGTGTEAYIGRLALNVSSTTADGIYIRNSGGGGNLDLVTLGSNYNSHGVSPNDTWLYSGNDINIGGATGWANNVQIVGNGAIRMKVSSAGIVTKPYQPSFRAGRSGDYTPSAGAVVLFNTVNSSGHFNIGGHYDTSNGRFTCPVAGRYYIKAIIIYGGLSNGQDMADSFKIKKNGVNQTYSSRRSEYVDGTTGNAGYFVDHADIIINASASQYIEVTVGRNLQIHGNSNYTMFMGYLIG